MFARVSRTLQAGVVVETSVTKTFDFVGTVFGLVMPEGSHRKETHTQRQESNTPLELTLEVPAEHVKSVAALLRQMADELDG